MQRRSKFVVAGCAILGAQALLSSAWSRVEYLPSPPPLSNLPPKIGSWAVEAERTLDPDVLSMLAPDDTVNRIYTNSDGSGTSADMFIAYYKSQHRAKGAHDPKVCLPGSGWQPVESKKINIPVPHSGAVISANYYVIKKGFASNIVIDWFQTVEGTMTEVETLRLSKVFTSVRKNRSDMALVRIIVPLNAANKQQSNDSAIGFAKLLYPALSGYFPHQ